MQLKEQVYYSIFCSGITSFILEGCIRYFRDVKLRNFKKKREIKETFPPVSGIFSGFIQNLCMPNGEKVKKDHLDSNCIYHKQYFPTLAPWLHCFSCVSVWSVLMVMSTVLCLSLHKQIKIPTVAKWYFTFHFSNRKTGSCFQRGWQAFWEAIERKHTYPY